MQEARDEFRINDPKADAKAICQEAEYRIGANTSVNICIIMLRKYLYVTT